MRSTLLTMALAVLLSFSSLAQVRFQYIPFEEALAKAKAEDKLIFLQLEPLDCRQCSEVAEKGLSEASLSQTINQGFIPLFIGAKHVSRREVENRFNLGNDAFGTLFVDQNGTLIHRFTGTSSASDHYKREMDIALVKAGEALKVSQLEDAYRKGNKTLGFLEALLLKKSELGLDNTELLDEYVSLLPEDSLASVHSLQFIASLAPVIGTKAHQVMRQNQPLFNRAWYALPLNKRVGINNRIIHFSLNKAVREQDEKYALSIAQFAKSTVTSTAEAAEKAYYYRLLEFYDRTNSKAKYLSTATTYYGTYLMTVDVDSIKRLDEQRKQQMLAAASKDTVRTPNGFKVTSSITYAPVAQRYTSELREGARNVYRRTNDEHLLAIATTWAKRALAFHETPEAYDVYARLLYKQGRRKEAIEAGQKVVDLKKARRFPVDEALAVLSLMERGEPLND